MKVAFDRVTALAARLFNIGTLCVIGPQPREVTAAEIATLEDLAAIVIDELELRHAARSEEQRLEQVRADFTTTVSHELKTPLAAVYGAAITLARTDGAVDEETRTRLLTVITEQGERLRSMFEDVLATSQLESGNFRIVSDELQPAQIAHSGRCSTTFSTTRSNTPRRRPNRARCRHGHRDDSLSHP